MRIIGRREKSPRVYAGLPHCEDVALLEPNLMDALVRAHVISRLPVMSDYSEQ